MKKGLISMGILAGFLLSILVVSGVFAQKDVVAYRSCLWEGDIHPQEA